MGEIKTIVVMGAGKILPSELVAQIQLSHGMDVVIISGEEAIEKGVISKNTLQIEQKPFIFKAPPVIQMPELFYDKHQAKNDCKKGWRKNKY